MAASSTPAPTSSQAVPLTQKKTYYSVESVHPNHQKWPIKVRVFKKTGIKTTQRCKFFTMNLIDQWKGEIKASVFNDDCDQFYPYFEVGGVYVIAHAQVGKVDPSRSSLKNDCEIVIRAWTEVSRLDDDDEAIPSLPEYNFSTIGQVLKMKSGTYADVMGAVRLVEELPSSPYSTPSRQNKRLKVVLCDQTGSEIPLFVWLEEYSQPLSCNKYPDILVLQGARVDDHLKGRALATVSTTLLQINPPNFKETRSLTNWSRTWLFTNSWDSSDWNDKTTLAEIVEEQMKRTSPSYFTIKAMTKSVNGSECLYRGCVTCHKKVQEQYDIENDVTLYYCTKCEKTLSSGGFSWRLFLRVELCDFSSSLQVTCFNQPLLEEHLGKTCAELLSLMSTNPREYEKVFDRLSYTFFVFRLRLTRTFPHDEGNAQLKARVINIRSMDYADHSKRLLMNVRMERKNPFLPMPVSPSKRDVSRPHPNNPVKRKLSFH